MTKLVRRILAVKDECTRRQLITEIDSGKGEGADFKIDSSA